MLMAGARPTASPVMYRMLPLSQMRLYNQQQKYFSSGVVTQTKRCFSEQPAVVQEETQESLSDINARLGVDTVFSSRKHAYVLTFPWNFDEIVDEF